MLRITRILFVAAIALVAAAPAASAAPAATRQTTLQNYLALGWKTVLETPDAENPFGSGGSEFACVDLGGTVWPIATAPDQSCVVKPGTKVLVTTFSTECSTFEGTSEPELAKVCGGGRCLLAGRYGHRRWQARASCGRLGTAGAYRLAARQRLRATGWNGRRLRCARLRRATAPVDTGNAFGRYHERRVHPDDVHRGAARRLALQRVRRAHADCEDDVPPVEASCLARRRSRSSCVIDARIVLMAERPRGSSLPILLGARGTVPSITLVVLRPTGTHRSVRCACHCPTRVPALRSSPHRVCNARSPDGAAHSGQSAWITVTARPTAACVWGD